MLIRCLNIPHLAYFPYFEEIRLGLCDLHAVCVSLYPPINFWIAEPVFMKSGMYIMAPEPIQRRTS
jgi:hypothetical protein